MPQYSLIKINAKRIKTFSAQKYSAEVCINFGVSSFEFSDFSPNFYDFSSDVRNVR